MRPGERVPHPLRHFVIPLVVFTAAVVYGTAGYMVLERFSFLDAVFETLSTITTIGFQTGHPLDDTGRIFTITLIIFGVLGFLYTVGVIVEELASGGWRDYRRYRRMDERLRALRDHVVVCGYGRTGKQVVSEIEATGAPCAVVEINERPLEDVRRDDRVHVVGDAASDEVLELAGIRRARALVSAVDSDERNVYIVLTARSMNPGLFIVARSSYPDSQPKLHRAGANRVVSPYTISGHRMAALALQPAVVDVLDIVMTGESGQMAIEELLVPRELSAAELRASGATLLAVRSAAGPLSVGIGDDQTLAPEDLVVAMGTPEQLATLASRLRPALPAE